MVFKLSQLHCSKDRTVLPVKSISVVIKCLSSVHSFDECPRFRDTDWISWISWISLFRQAPFFQFSYTAFFSVVVVFIINNIYV